MNDFFQDNLGDFVRGLSCSSRFSVGCCGGLGGEREGKKEVLIFFFFCIFVFFFFFFGIFSFSFSLYLPEEMEHSQQEP